VLCFFEWCLTLFFFSYFQCGQTIFFVYQWGLFSFVCPTTWILILPCWNALFLLFSYLPYFLKQFCIFKEISPHLCHRPESFQFESIWDEAWESKSFLYYFCLLVLFFKYFFSVDFFIFQIFCFSCCYLVKCLFAAVNVL